MPFRWVGDDPKTGAYVDFALVVEKDFSLVVEKDRLYAEGVRIHRYESSERE